MCTNSDVVDFVWPLYAPALHRHHCKGGRNRIFSPASSATVAALAGVELRLFIYMPDAVSRPDFASKERVSSRKQEDWGNCCAVCPSLQPPKSPVELREEKRSHSLIQGCSLSYVFASLV